MKFHHTLLAGLVSLGGVLAGQDAGAVLGQNGFTVPMTMVAIETDGDGFIVFPDQLPNDSTNDPANCQPTGSHITWMRVHTGNIGEGAPREILAKTVQSAFLSGRNIKLWVSGTSCSGTAPRYYAAQLN